ncbi:MAG: gamma-glutamyl-gamma-aminobutyrate hydrolase family protein [Terracidiphilus sp.]|nr:gamma-glutamyl-gamma-aminobutyrate hydrolase family protein [Terracidiphilus sp.]MDR3775473.1 gamma-glutamyl-gamma-aminobutyrate hydrolase family protein [Terracidiphilus sp.]
MSIHIAIPEPTSSDTAYNQRSLPAYLFALHAAGASAVIVPLHERQDRVARLLSGVQGILLPGSRYDIDPQRYGEDPTPECSEPDPSRAAVDELLLQDGFNLQKPILAICHGAQTLNVWRNGSLIQDLKTEVNHRPGREVIAAHPVRVAEASRLAALLPHGDSHEVHVNSSHHQAIRQAGDNLLVSAVSPEDGVIEAVESNSAEHFVLGVQWHPERTYSVSPFSRAIFAAFVKAAAAWEPKHIAESVARA